MVLRGKESVCYKRKTNNGPKCCEQRGGRRILTNCGAILHRYGERHKVGGGVNRQGLKKKIITLLGAKTPNQKGETRHDILSKK